VPPSPSVLRLFRAQWFSLSLVALFFFAWALPSVGRALNPGNATMYFAVAATFFLTGTTLRWRESAAALTAWRIHLFIQGIGFVAIPVAVWLLLLPFRARLPDGLVLGFYLLSILPTTISSNVVFTQLSGGNTPAAVCNAVFGNAAGVFICPWLLMLMIGGAYPVHIDALAVLAKLGLTVLAPLLVGCVIGRLRPDPTDRRRRRVAFCNAQLVLLIVWFAFCNLFVNRETLSSGAGVAPILLLIVPAHLSLLAAVAGLGRLLGFSRPDRIALLFCAPQKTLSLGLPMIAACLAARPELIGLASLPIVVYHPTQLLIAGFLKDRLNAKIPPPPGTAT
jgi:sodium/bile acid cotransporter 7